MEYAERSVNWCRRTHGGICALPHPHTETARHFGHSGRNVMAPCQLTFSLPSTYHRNISLTLRHGDTGACQYHEYGAAVKTSRQPSFDTILLSNSFHCHQEYSTTHYRSLALLAQVRAPHEHDLNRSTSSSRSKNLNRASIRKHGEHR